MTERYSHLDARLISSVTEAQSVITGGEKPGRGNSKRRPNLQLVKTTESETAPKRKRA
jgi:hypothetical protein